MSNKQNKWIIEAALMSAGKTLTIDELRNLFSDEQKPSKKDVSAILAEIEENCSDLGYELKETASGYRFQAKPELAKWLAKLWPEKAPRLSKALLETISIIAYKQPVTRAEVEDIRGVSVSTNIIKTLLDRKWIKSLGHKEIPGRPSVYGTTGEFLDYFNVKSLNDLPTMESLPQITEELFPPEETVPIVDEGSLQEEDLDDTELDVQAG